MIIKIQNGEVSNEYAVSRKLAGNEKENKNGKLKNGSVFAGNLNQKSDPVSIRKEQAQKRAMKLWTDAVGAEQKIDLDLDERAAHMEKLRGVMDELQGQINSISDMQEALKEQYGITDDSREQQDVELLIRASKDPLFSFQCSEEEGSRLKELKANPLSEYASRYLELEDAKGVYTKQLHENNKEYLAESNMIEGIKQGRLKSHSMVDAQKQKDEMMIAASKEAANMLMDEVKDNIDEKQAEREEKAEEKAKKEQEEQERLEAIREDKEEQDEDEDSLEIPETAGLLQIDGLKEEVKQEVQKMVNEMNLLVEDLKGAAVDKNL